MSIKKEAFGTLACGAQVERYTMTNALGAGDGEGGAVVPGVSSERISPSCTVML